MNSVAKPLQQSGTLNSLRRGVLAAAGTIAVTLASAPTLHAATITAASPAYTDVNAAVSAAASGDTVVVPAGHAIWSSTLRISRSLILRGAGIGLTVITSGINNNNAYMLAFSPLSPASNPPFELSGFTFNGNATSGILSIDSNSSTIAITKINVHHNRFVNARSRAIQLPGLEFGVFHHNQFEANYISISTLFAEGAGWNYPLTLGGANYPYFEDNTFVGGANLAFVTESGRGGRLVFRRNAISNYGANGAEVWDLHGVTGTYPSDTGSVSGEIYENDVTLTAGVRVLFHRGGKGLIFNNRFTGVRGSLMMTEYQGWSYCTAAGYPKPQQVNETFFFNNIHQGVEMTPSLYCTSGSCTSCGQYDSTYIKVNRDYWLPPSGPASARPASCTTNTYYGATDTGVISRCVAPNTWATYYTPYPYPHPLQGGTSSSPPKSPTNVRIIY